jgi:hypothetical protein
MTQESLHGRRSRPKAEAESAEAAPAVPSRGKKKHEEEGGRGRSRAAEAEAADAKAAPTRPLPSPRPSTTPSTRRPSCRWTPSPSTWPTGDRALCAGRHDAGTRRRQDREALKAFMPAIRNNILMVLAHKTSARAAGARRQGQAGRRDPCARPRARWASRSTSPEEDAAADDAPRRRSKKKPPDVELPVVAVHFSNFIIQCPARKTSPDRYA